MLVVSQFAVSFPPAHSVEHLPHQCGFVALGQASTIVMLVNTALVAGTALSPAAT
jgi:hypothetical protein